jgi:hypothetical protein
MSKEYETIISFAYEANNPVDAAQQFIDNIPHATWFLTVKDTETGKEFTVDTEDWSVE